MKRGKKLRAKLYSRQVAWEQTCNNGGDAFRKFGKAGFRKPGSRPGVTK